ncbi:MAG: uracil-DNA glycosylase family protein [Prevotella sp.]|uniref:uracil-DNA glycosylase family protein n=1 Tax=Prevotella sp. TaxID=59823 RepID=UPI002586D888|nr:uracil-DNA glycosylase family protein [Prevotella sp.]MDD6854559.1 uracil-DNA glycosylase family protein [Prevotella sp.]
MDIETHPFEPFLPKNAKLILLGTFPPAPKRWCMEWYYPNFMNDMWRIIGLCFFGDKEHFVKPGEKTWHLDELKDFLAEKGIAIFDTCVKIRRTKGTASDKDLEVIEQADIDGLLHYLSQCRAVLCAGQLATTIFTSHYGIRDAKKMKMGSFVNFDFEGRTLRLYREPSSSRAYPMKVEKKAEYYSKMFEEVLGE